MSDLARALAESIEANGLRLSQPGCIQRPDQAVLALADSLAARHVGIVAEIDAAIADLVSALPDGWAWSVTNVPSAGEWGCSASRTGPDVTPADVVQTGTARSMAEAIRAMAVTLRNRGTARVWP